MAQRDHGGSNEPRDHVGFYLIDRGQDELKAAFGYRPLWRERLLDRVRGHANAVYFGSITLGLVVATVLVIALALKGVSPSGWFPCSPRSCCCRCRRSRLAWSTRC